MPSESRGRARVGIYQGTSDNTPGHAPLRRVCVCIYVYRAKSASARWRDVTPTLPRPAQMAAKTEAARAAKAEAEAKAARAGLNEAAGDFNRRLGQWEAPSAGGAAARSPPPRGRSPQPDEFHSPSARRACLPPRGSGGWHGHGDGECRDQGRCFCQTGFTQHQGRGGP